MTEHKTVKEFNKWLAITGLVSPASSYYYELKSFIENAIKEGRECERKDILSKVNKCEWCKNKDCKNSVPFADCQWQYKGDKT